MAGSEYDSNRNSIKETRIIERIEMAITHLKNLSEQKIEKLAVLEIRNHISWYLKGLKDSNEVKNKVYKCNTVEEIMIILKKYKNEIHKNISEL